MFIIGTLLVPIMGIGFTVIPALLFSIEGDATRIAVVDQNGKLYESVKNALNTQQNPEQPRDRREDLTKSQEEQVRDVGEQAKARFIVEEIKPDNETIEQIKDRLNGRLREDKLDAYILIPSDFEDGSFELFARNTSDFVAQGRIERALNQAVREARLSQANISTDKMDAINREINFATPRRISDEGESEDSGESFMLLFIVGFLIYLVLAIYGQQILAAVVEEKETRISEILFSSARPFTLMIGKLIGVGLVALTQLAIWVISGIAIAIYGISRMQAFGEDFKLPQISPFFIAGLFIFFLLGFFTYATIYALIGSMVTTVQEGGQLALPPILLLLVGFYCAFPVIRSPNSDFSVWISILPFVSPIVMPIRMAIQMPPFWQIGLSILASLVTIIALTWLAAKVYRIGMLMYGKRATIPEVFRWIREQ